MGKSQFKEQLNKEPSLKYDSFLFAQRTEIAIYRWLGPFREIIFSRQCACS